MERNHICNKCGGIAGWDSYFQSWICTRCGDIERKPITNYDRIISKSPEELAVWLAQQEYRRPRFDGWLPLCNHVMGAKACHAHGCKACWLDWLKQEDE